jgi:(4S)-4-hydroxy-5-phosphonooxypentane-2,3-dione isomerase
MAKAAPVHRPAASGLLSLPEVFMLVVVVRFDLKEGSFEPFRAAILENAAQSRTEPGCHRFDVAFSEDGRRCFLYELYTDEPAFRLHGETAHYQKFAREAAPLFDEKKAEIYHLADAG